MWHASDQIPLWVKKPSNREVFAAHEVKKSAKDVTSHREEIRQELDKKAHDKGIVETENPQREMRKRISRLFLMMRVRNGTCLKQQVSNHQARRIWLR